MKNIKITVAALLLALTLATSAGAGLPPTSEYWSCYRVFFGWTYWIGYYSGDQSGWDIGGGVYCYPMY